MAMLFVFSSNCAFASLLSGLEFAGSYLFAQEHKKMLAISNTITIVFFICLSPFSQKNHFRLSLCFSSLRYISFKCSARGLSERKGEKK